MRVAILSDVGAIVESDEVGELVLCGPQLATGHLDDPEQTARRFPELDHPRAGRARWYRTGDSAFRDGQGRFHCLGRVDNQVRVMGHRVELEEIEAHLRRVCGTDAVAAVAWPITGGSATGIVAFVCASQIAPAAVRDALRDRLPPYMVPHQVVASETLPLSPNGKVDRKALRSTLEGNP
jgi:D-alanine--poly(phosphoribitol) ligase subunit 1